MPTDLQTTIVFVARLLLGGAFLVAGLRNIGAINGLAGFIGTRGLPLPRLAAIIGVALEIVGGALVAIGPFALYGGLGLVVFCVLATLIFHNFWDYQGAERVTHLNAFISNTALSGGFLLVAATA
jgi:putative oxidoreductase